MAAGNTLVAIQDVAHLQHVALALQELNPATSELIALHVRDLSRTQEAGERHENSLTDEESELFSKIVHIAEREGKPLQLATLLSHDPIQAILRTAHRLRSARVLLSCSKGKKPADQERAIAFAWEELSAPGQRCAWRLYRLATNSRGWRNSDLT